MSLGNRLRETLKSEIEAKLDAERKALEAAIRRAAVIRESHQSLIHKIQEDFIDQIIGGKKPSYKITATDQRSWINSCNRNTSQDIDADLWINFTDWLKQEDLILKITEEHDYQGSSDWIVVRAIPAPFPEADED